MATYPTPKGNELNPEPGDALAMLKADHRHVQTLLTTYEGAGDFVTRRQIAELVFSALALHAYLEEEVFYPAYEARTGRNGTQLVADSRLDHEQMKELMIEMHSLELEEAEFEGKFQELMHTVQEHIAEEENDMFPEAEHILADQLGELKTQMVALKQQRSTAPAVEAQAL
ncbi:MAG: hemerythrin domain-containing protein [Candidatus Tectimicrobiota bacterium]